jgi:hypothetical protein
LITPPLSAFHFHTRRAHPLDDELRGDTRVVHTRQPKRFVAAHAAPADEHVDLRMFEHMADVNRPGHVRRRKRNREGAPAIGP